MNKFIGSEVEVLIEETKDGYSYGHTDNILLNSNAWHVLIVSSNNELLSPGKPTITSVDIEIDG